MAETVVLTKILHVREKEKNDAQKAYHQSLAFFEEVATQLYGLLRKKEIAEETYEEYIKKPTQLEMIREQVSYIEMLNREILKLQQEVQQARAEMESKQGKLTNAHVEVKKFEKIIEYRENTKAEIVRKNEETSMNEISIQQYLTQKNR